MSSPTKQTNLSGGFIDGIKGVLNDYVFNSPLNTCLSLLIAFFVYRLIKSQRNRRRSEHDNQSRDEFELPPPMVKHDMTLEELKQYDGRAQDKRICIAIKGKVYDVTKGYRFYGPNGPYAPLAGHDASRALATFNVNAVKDEFDDLSDLNATEMSSVNEWEEQFSERYDLVGSLVRNKDEIDNDNDINDE